VNDTLRSALKLGLAAVLAIGITQWSGRSNTLMMALMGVVLFVNENETAPVRRVFQLFGGAVIGVIAGLLIFGFSRGWLALAVALLATGLLIRVLRLQAGLGTAYLCCWAALVMVHGNRFEIGVLFNLVLPFVIGTLAAQFATWLVWPKLRRRRMEQLDQQIAARFQRQLQGLQVWLSHGGPPPAVLHSSELLPAIQQLQQLGGTRSTALPPQLQQRWRQMGTLWRQVLRQWLLLEPQLHALPAPLPAGLPPLLSGTLEQLDRQLIPGAAPTAGALPPESARAQQWQAWGEAAGTPVLVPLALGMQLDQFSRLLRSQALLRNCL